MKKHLIIFFILGVIFRLWIANLIPQPFAFDQTEYHNFALQILDKGLVAWQARLYGYPLFLAIIYKVFGIGNFLAVAVMQSIVDCLTALLIYKIAGRIFSSQKIAWISYVLYLFNPFTSVFVALTLSEVWGVFLVAVVTYLLFPPPQGSASAHPRGVLRLTFLWLVLGYLPQVRPAFLFYSVIMIAIIVIKFYKSYIQIPPPQGSASAHPRGVFTAFLFILLFFLPFTYNIAGNWRDFRQVSPTTVDNLFVREFYISLYVPDRSPFHAKSPDVFPPQVQKIYNEYTPLPQNAEERKAMAGKYLNLGLAKVGENPLEFIISRLQKFWYVWEKHFLYYYEQPENKLVDFATYWGNNLLLAAAAFGFFVWYKVKRKKNFWLAGFVLFTVIYISAVHSFSLAEERYSLPGYPLIFLFAGYGVWDIIKRLLMVNG